MSFILSEHNSVANRFIAELRDVNIQKDSMRFRRNLERLGEVLAYEISKTFEYTDTTVETPLGIAQAQIAEQRVVLGTILRAGLPMHQGFLHFLDAADNAFISAYRMHHKDGTFEIQLEYVSCPNVDGCVLILCDAMIATGASMSLAIKSLLEFGTPAQIHVVAALASTYGKNYIRRLFPKAKIWLGAVDDELTARSFIVPGLGDAGDLAYGSKIQE